MEGGVEVMPVAVDERLVRGLGVGVGLELGLGLGLGLGLRCD